MSSHIRYLPLLLLLLAAAACTLPGAASPTPFTFPTPNLTLTAIFAPTETPTPGGPTAPPPPSATSSSSGSATPTAATSATPTAPVGLIRPNGFPVTAQFLPTPPSIDGDLGGWTGPTFTASQCVFGCALYSGPNDLSASYYLGYDSTALYLGININDDTHVQLSTGHLMYRGDDVEIQLDTNLAGDFADTFLSSDDYQIGLSAGNFGSRPPEAYRWYPVSRQAPLPGVLIKAKQLTGGYTLEAKIPWSVFNLTPTSGARFGFALSLSDDDLPGSAVQQSLVSSVATRKLANPTTWGTLILAPSGGS
jgi:hypothetical protein